MAQLSNASFLGLALQGSASKLLRDTLVNLGIPLRNSLHDNYEEHQVVEITHGYLEFYTKAEESDRVVLFFESENIEASLEALPEGFEVIYKGETELENYSMVIICDHPQGLQVKIYERTTKS